MEVDDGHIPDDVFEGYLERWPQVCVELVLQTDDGILLCNRGVKPKLWFGPGLGSTRERNWRQPPLEWPAKNWVSASKSKNAWASILTSGNLSRSTNRSVAIR